MKQPKLFISHKTEDKPFVSELVRLLEFIVGSGEDRIFCSSIAGYDIKPGREILKELKRQFDEYGIFFIVVHSPRYYKSAICLNEMGAAWALGSSFCSFLTDDCSYKLLEGVIDGKYMSIKVNDNYDTVVSKLNYLKDELLHFFSIDSFNQNRWETIRNEFIERTQHIEYTSIDMAEERTDTPHPEAMIMADVIGSSPVVIDITNRGDRIAENLTFELDEVASDMIVSGLEIFPLEYLKPGKHVRISLFPCIGDPEKFKVYFSWKERGVLFKSEDIIVI